jgi:predicted 3-demethylubiquinone-9 3-methyltransferase (glyoxalase superfamily)
MQKITPFLWFEKDADQVAKFYTSVFDDSRIKQKVTLHDTPSGTVDIINVEILGLEFELMAAGPLFKFTPAISFLVGCSTQEEVEKLWAKLSEGGSALMPLDRYPFSEKYGWIQDKYGLSWQVMFMGDRPITHRITPTLMFVGKEAGRTEEAIRFYASVFKKSEIGDIVRYTPEDKPEREGTVKYGSFKLEGQQFAAMDSAREHNFNFNEAISLEVRCRNQEELDYYWNNLSADPKSEQCGWLKDQYGVSWQVVPTVMDEMMKNGNSQQLARLTQAFLKMKKFNIAELKRAYEGD